MDSLSATYWSWKSWNQKMRHLNCYLHPSNMYTWSDCLLNCCRLWPNLLKISRMNKLWEAPCFSAKYQGSVKYRGMEHLKWSNFRRGKRGIFVFQWKLLGFIRSARERTCFDGNMLSGVEPLQDNLTPVDGKKAGTQFSTPLRGVRYNTSLRGALSSPHALRGISSFTKFFIKNREKNF